MATSENPIPLILCGLQEAIGSKVIEGLKPEYEGGYSYAYAYGFCL